MDKKSKSFKFKFVAKVGLTNIDLSTIEGLEHINNISIVTEDGHELELSPGHSDGEITLYASNRLVIRPRATNCARVSSED